MRKNKKKSVSRKVTENSRSTRKCEKRKRQAKSTRERGRRVDKRQKENVNEKWEKSTGRKCV